MSLNTDKRGDSSGQPDDYGPAVEYFRQRRLTASGQYMEDRYGFSGASPAKSNEDD